MTFGRPHRHYRRCDSTNTRARELAAAGAPGGMVVTADEQHSGRGRQGRTWTAPPGKALLYSAILRPLERRHRLLPLAVPLAVCDAAESLVPGLECEVKWPNDVWIEGRKCAGVLIEARPQDGWAVIGVGLNLAVEPEDLPPEARQTATSLGHGISPSRARESLDRSLGEWVLAPEEAVLERFRERDALRGRRIGWNGGVGPEGGSGVAAGVDDAGNLVVAVAGGGEVHLGAGEVHLAV